MKLFDQNKLFKSAGKDRDAAWEHLLPCNISRHAVYGQLRLTSRYKQLAMGISKCLIRGVMTSVLVCTSVTGSHG